MNAIKKWVFLVASLLLWISPVLAQNQVKHVSKAGHFSITFPGAPSETTKIDSSNATNPTVIHYVTWFPNDSVGYMVDWVDLGKSYPGANPMKKILEDSRDGAMRTIRATNVITTATVLEKDPYIEFAFTNEEFTGRARIYIIRKFQYTIITLFPRSIGISKDADKFIKSFKYIPW